MMRKCACILTIAVWAFNVNPLPAGPTINLVISEVLFNEPGNFTSKEWIEIFNPTQNAINLTGYTLNDNSSSYAIVNGTIISSGQVIVFAKRPDMLGFTPDFTNLNLLLNNGGDKVELRNASNVIVDFVAWGNFIGGWGLSAGDAQSIRRIALPTDPSSWLSNQTPTPKNASPLVVVPEPGSFVLAAFGLLGLMLLRSSKKNDS